MVKLNILGTEYTLEIVKREDDSRLSSQQDIHGLCDFSSKEIFIVDFQAEKGPSSIKDLCYITKSVAKHEIIHAFLYESGFDAAVHDFSDCEDMIDWISLQSNKMFMVFKIAEEYVETYCKVNSVDLEPILEEYFSEKKHKTKKQKEDKEGSI